MIYPSKLKQHKRKRFLLKLIPIVLTVAVITGIFVLRNIKPNNYTSIPKSSIGYYPTSKNESGRPIYDLAKLKAVPKTPEAIAAAQDPNSPTYDPNFSIDNAMDTPVVDAVNAPLSQAPDYSIDFGNIPSGTLLSSMFRIQNGVDDDWNPSWNNEKQMYTPKDVYISNGNLVIKAMIEPNGQITSGKVDTQGFFQATYGKFEIVAKMPKGAGTFPGIWLLPADGSYFRDNIATASEKALDISWQGGGEIDIAEYLGILPNSVFHDVHNYNSISSNLNTFSGETIVNNLSNDYHTFGVIWTANSIAFTVDGTVTHSVNKTSSNFRDWPFDKPFYLILNLAMGGTWNDQAITDAGQSFPNGVDNSQQANWQLLIKSIKHYPLQ